MLRLVLEELLGAVGAPGACAGALKEDFALAASLPPAAMIPPRAMVVQAGGSQARGCALRILRYLTPAAPEDVLQYHHVRASRAGFAPTSGSFSEPLIRPLAATVCGPSRT